MSFAWLEQQLEEIDTFFASIREDLNQLTIPFYIAQAGQDEMISPNSGERLAEHLNQASLSLYNFPESTHVITAGTQFVEFQETLVDFVDHLDWSVEK